ncbi:MAG: nitroreductase family protein [Methanosarcina barkeri]|nr:nitroreductase family protein [Methanosarcina sp. ERenArc_MAG2]
MDTLEAIHTRRSIRKYTDRPVSQELVTELLRAAMSAPSAVNSQPWVFIVIDDRKLLEEIPTFSPYAGMCREASLAILICGDTTQEKFPDTGCRTVRQQPRISCLQLMLSGLEQSGQESIR